MGQFPQPDDLTTGRGQGQGRGNDTARPAAAAALRIMKEKRGKQQQQGIRAISGQWAVATAAVDASWERLCVLFTAKMRDQVASKTM